MNENGKMCSCCYDITDEMALITVIKGEDKKHIWLCKDCYEELFGEEE